MTKWAPGFEPIRIGPKCDRCRQRCRRPRYVPFCSYDCQQRANLEAAQRYVMERRAALVAPGAAPKPLNQTAVCPRTDHIRCGCLLSTPT